MSKFELANSADLKPLLLLPDGKPSKKHALRKVVSNMTVSNPQMLHLFPEIVRCLKTNDTEIKRLCLLYLETYAKSKPTQSGDALQYIKNEVLQTENYVVSAIALRTMSNVPLKQYAQATIEVVPQCLHSNNSYLRKTACFAVAKAFSLIPDEVQSSKVLERVNKMLARENSPVVASAAAQALLCITSNSSQMDFVIDFPTSLRLANMLPECPEFPQCAILMAICHFVPKTSLESEQLSELVVPGLRHTNAAVAIGSARVLLMLSHYSTVLQDVVFDQIFLPLLSQLNRPVEIQYMVLRNLLLILQFTTSETLSRLRIPPQSFFCNASDLAYIRLTKMDILAALCTPSNSKLIIKELLEFTRVNDSVSKQRAISLLGSVGMKIEEISSECAFELIKFAIKGENEAVTSIVNLIRRYPSASFVDPILEKLFSLEEIPSEVSAREAFVFLVGCFYQKSAHATKILLEVINNFSLEPLAVQHALLAACVRVFMKFPRETQGLLVPKIFELCTEQSPNPDLREKALMYWRILAVSPVKMAQVVNYQMVPIIKQTKQDPNSLEDLELSLGYLSSVYMKPAEQLFRVSRVRQLKPSKALLPRKFDADDDDDTHYQTPSNFVHSPQEQQHTGYFNRVPLPRGRTSTEQSLQQQFSGMDLNSGMGLGSALVEDHNERLIDI